LDDLARLWHGHVARADARTAPGRADRAAGSARARRERGLMAQAAPLVVVAAGGTGGHLFPAEALAVALGRRGVSVDLATDERAVLYGADFPARQTHIIASATVRGRDPGAPERTDVWIGRGGSRGRRV